MRHQTAFFVAAIVLSAYAGAAQTDTDPAAADEPVSQISVVGIRNPALRSYRVLSAGLDAFETHRHLAPNATLKFKLIKPDELVTSKPDWSKAELTLTADDLSLPVPVSADGTFVVPRNQQAYDEQADLVLNQKKNAAFFLPIVQTAGLASTTRRLGDVRLECQVIMAMGKKELSFIRRAVLTTLMGTGDWCTSKRAQFTSTWPDWPLTVAQLNGATRKMLPVRRARFYMPIYDASIPDDTLYEFEFWGDASDERKRQYLASFPLTLKTSMNNWGPGPVFQVDEHFIYKATIAFKTGDWQLNFESADREIVFGTLRGATAAAANVVHPLLWHGRDRLRFKVEQAGQYEVALDLSDLDRPAVTIRRAD
jgi:hypothetical protein